MIILVMFFILLKIENELAMLVYSYEMFMVS